MTRNLSTISRHDVPQSVVRVVETCLANRVWDAWSLVEVVTTHGRDWNGIVYTACEHAYANYHSETGRDVHAEVVKAAQEWWRERDEAEARAIESGQTPGPFGKNA